MGGYNESVVLGAAAATDLGMRRAFPTVTKRIQIARRMKSGRPFSQLLNIAAAMRRVVSTKE